MFLRTTIQCPLSTCRYRHELRHLYPFLPLQMIAEPYICIRGDNAGPIQWAFSENDKWISPDGLTLLKTHWQPYADFEREKLEALKEETYTIGLGKYDGFIVLVGEAQKKYSSLDMVAYSTPDFMADSESSRLLKRAEFLREVCKREEVTWLPEVCDTCGKHL